VTWAAGASRLLAQEGAAGVIDALRRSTLLTSTPRTRSLFLVQTRTSRQDRPSGRRSAAIPMMSRHRRGNCVHSLREYETISLDFVARNDEQTLARKIALVDSFLDGTIRLTPA
jgi:hypothetical protein